jgi:hypothetical protein
MKYGRVITGKYKVDITMMISQSKRQHTRKKTFAYDFNGNVNRIY